MIEINTNINYYHELLLLVAHELQLLNKFKISYRLVDKNANVKYGNIKEFKNINSFSDEYKLGPIFAPKYNIFPEVIYVENLSLHYKDYQFDNYESITLETNNLLEEVFGMNNNQELWSEKSVFMFYNKLIDEEAIKKLTYAVNETVRILNSIDFYSKENMFEYFLICDQKTLTDISFQIHDFIKLIDDKNLIKMKKSIKKM
jgi:hypothetical protein